MTCPREPISSMQERLLRLEERLAELKAIPSDATHPLLKSAKRSKPKEPKVKLQKSSAHLLEKKVPAEWGRNKRDQSSDFDFCFKFPSPCHVDHLNDASTDKDEDMRKARLTASKQALAKENEENEWFLSELRARRQSMQESKCASRYPKKHRAVGGNSAQLSTSEVSEDIHLLLVDFLIEERDRQALSLLQEASCIRDARIMTICLLLDFFQRAEELYEIRFFQSVDHDEIFMCVKMTEATVAEHAQASNFRVQLKQEELRTQLGVIIPATGPQPPAYACYNHYLAEADLVKELPDESEKDAKTRFRKADRIRLLYDRITNVLDIDAMRQWKLLLDFYPLHSKTGHAEIQKKLCQGWLLEPPLDDINDYFGSQVATYFAFASLLCQALCVLTAAVMVLAIYVAWKENSVRAAFTDFLYGQRHWEVRVALSIVLIIWVQVFDTKLKAKVRWCRLMWGEEHYPGATHVHVKDRLSPRFQGVLMESEVDHSLKVVGVPEKKKVRGRHISKLLTGIFGAIVTLVMFGIYLVAAWLYLRGHRNVFMMTGYAISVAIRIFQALWDTVSDTLIDMEYHLLEVDYFNSWSVKTMIIQMICSFSPFVYIGFVMPYVDRCQQVGGDCFGYLCYEMVIVFLLYNAFTLWDIFYPVACMKAKKYWEKRAAEKIGEEAYSLGFLEEQSKMNEYDASCLAEDYCEHILPLAFVLLFGITLPCSPALALTSSLLQLHVDAFKLTHFLQRPYPLNATYGLGVWAEIFDAVAFLAVYTNVGIISFLLTPCNSYSWHWQLLMFFALSTCVHFGRRVIAVLLPVEDSVLMLAIERQKRQNEVVQRVLHHYSASLVMEKPKCHPQNREHVPPCDLLRRAEEAIKPLAFTVRSDLDFTSVPRLGSDDLPI